MQIVWKKAPSTKLHNLIPGDTFVCGEAVYMVTDSDNVIPAPLPDYIYCVNLESGHLAIFTSTDVVFLTKVKGEIQA